SSRDLYPVTQPSPTPHDLLSVSPSTWHQRLGHPEEEVLRSLVSRQFISCNKEKSHHICHACQLGKLVRLPFSSSDSVVTRCFEIVHYDIWTSPIVSSGGFKYYMLFLDHYSHYLWIYPLRTKSEVFQKFLHFRAYVNNQFKCDITAFQCDHGGEFDNTNLLQVFAVQGMFLSQKKYAMELLDGAHIASCNPTQTLVDTKSKLGADGNPIFDPILYRSLAGFNYMHHPLALVAYSDADWAGCLTTRRSTSGYCVSFEDNLLSWSCKRQHTLSRSSVEAEYQGVANVVTETAWLLNLLRELHMPLICYSCLL
nr:ribonuclease H-like domain-containing protein [Tanacetum cinerariifolium]